MNDTTTTTPITVTLQSDLVTAALCAVNKSETRYYLQGLFIDARGFIAGTNGHMLFAAHCRDAVKLHGIKPSFGDGALDGIIVPYDAILAASKSKSLTYDIQRDENGLWWLVYGATRAHFVPVDAHFPSWDRVIPEAPETETPAHYDPQYIAALGKMSAALQGKSKMTTSFEIRQVSDGPAQVTFPDDDGNARKDCIAVIMPMRGNVAGSFDRDAFLRG